MSTILDDEFTGSGAVTAHTSDSGHTWTDAPSIWFFAGSAGGAAYLSLASGAVENTAIPAGHGYFPSVVSNAVIPSDCFVEAHILGQTANTFLGFGLRFNVGSGNGLFVLINGIDTGPKISLPIESDLGGIADGTNEVPVANLTDYVIRMEVQGGTLRIYTDGVLRQTYTSDVSTAGTQVGFWISNNPGHETEGVIDYIHAGSLGGPPPFWTDYVKTNEVDA